MSQKSIVQKQRVFFATLLLAAAMPSYTQESGKAIVSREMGTATQTLSHFSAGQKVTLDGVIVNRQPDGFVVRDSKGSIYNVALTNATEVKERKSNPFRRARNFSTTDLLPGLDIEVKGAGDAQGNMVANEIRFRNDDYRYANSLDVRVQPVESQLKATETRVGRTEQNAQRLSGQLDELSAVSNAARGGAKAAQATADNAQSTADTALASANDANSGVKAANGRISSLDDFDVKDSTTIMFKVGSAVLTSEAKAELDKIAEEAKNERGFLVEVSGFASSEGGEALNRRLSQQRADAVIRYMGENSGLPIRRFVTPFGYGDKQPVADNKSRTGRSQNRRVEVKILLNKGLVQSASSSVASQ